MPMLKGKANEIKHLGPALLFAFQKMMTPSDAIHCDISLLLQMCVKLDTVLDEHKGLYRLPTPAAIEFQTAAVSVVALSTKLSRHFHPQDIALFNFTVKWHYTLHIGLLARYINPTLGWCYSGEDFISNIKNIVQMSARGCSPHILVEKTMQKYVLGLNISLTKNSGR